MRVLAVLIAILAPLAALAGEARLTERTVKNDVVSMKFETVFPGGGNLVGLNAKVGLCFAAVYAAAEGYRSIKPIQPLPACQPDGPGASSCAYAVLLSHDEPANKYVTPLPTLHERCPAGDPATLIESDAN